MKGRANYLCLHRLDQLSEGAGAGIARCVPADRPRVVDADRDRRSGRTRRSARGSAVLERGVGDGRDLHRHRVPALRRLLRHAHAAARRRVRRRHRQSPPAVRRCGGAAERLRRSDSRLQPRHRRRGAPARGRRHAVLRLLGQHLSASRTSRATWSVSPRPARVDDAKRAGRTRRRRSTACATMRARFSPSSRSRTGRNDRARGEERVRATDRSLAAARARRPPTWPARSTSLEARSRCSKPARDAQDDEAGRTGRRAAALARRAGEIRDELRFLLRAGDPAYVYFVEFRGKGIFLRASPIDVSEIIRDLLLDRMQATVLTSATLTVDGSFEYIRDRLGIAARRRDAAAVGVRLRDAGDPVSAAAHARPTVAGLRDGGGTPGDRAPQAQPRARVRAVHELRVAAGRAGDRRDGARLPDARPGHRAALPAAQAIPRNAELRALCHLEFLAGGRRRRRSAELRHRRQAAVRLAGRPDHGSADRGDPGARAASRSASTRCRWRSWRFSRGWAA